MPHVIIGTAGHIDHGKTALVKALTGVDTDRLKEEKERGLTIDLGFAHLGDRATIIDVPGHEKFIRNMVAGVSTIDLVLFVVAADDGVMPQTREHLDILRILQVKRGIVVITKKDLVDDEWLTLIADDIDKLVADTFLADAPQFHVSTIDMKGIPELQAELSSQLLQIEGKKDRGVFWLPVDRVFTMQGFGTVVTGTVLSGIAHVGDTMALLPQQRLHKIRGLQSHGRSVDAVAIGDRAAINLQGLEKQRAHRANILTVEGYAKPSMCIDARLSLLASAPRSIKSRMRIRLHIGTAEVMARIKVLGSSSLAPGENGFVQFQLEQPVVTRRLDAFVLRQYSPTITIGGGTVLEANAGRHRANDPKVIDKLKSLEQENPADVVEQFLLESRFQLKTAEQIASQVALAPENVTDIVEKLIADGKVRCLQNKKKSPFVHEMIFSTLVEAVMQGLKKYHDSNKGKLGLHKAELKKQIRGQIDDVLLNAALKQLCGDKLIIEDAGIIRTHEHQKSFVAANKELRKSLADALHREGLSTSSEAQLAEQFGLQSDKMRGLLGMMMTLEEIVRVEGYIYFHPGRVAEAESKLREFLHTNGEITVSQFRECLGISRKYALPLLLYFDGRGITRREGDVRVLGSG